MRNLQDMPPVAESCTFLSFFNNDQLLDGVEFVNFKRKVEKNEDIK